MSEEKDDACNWTVEERIEKLKEVLSEKTNYCRQGEEVPVYEFDFCRVRTEEFLKTNAARNRYEDGHGTQLYRQHYSVIVKSNLTELTEVFDYFCTEKRTKSRNAEAIKECKINADERVLGFLYCLASDYSIIQNAIIRDGIDLIKEFGYEPDAAREAFCALKMNSMKIKKIFDRTTWQKIEKVVDGY